VRATRSLATGTEEVLDTAMAGAPNGPTDGNGALGYFTEVIIK
jgi:hypothetical protein